jgi:hypothetical protein
MKTSRDVLSKSQYHLLALQNWKETVPANLAWDDSAVPSTNRNIACMRAKYYKALYMILRPCLQAAIAMDWSPTDRGFQCDPSTYIDKRIEVQMIKPNSNQAKILEYACICINAAIRSTIAFDRVGAPENSPYARYESTRTQRLVLTNIVGTMHAQFGNVLVLAEVYQSKMYQHLPHDILLTHSSLTALFERTISALEEIAPNSPTLRMDLGILQNARKKLFLSTNHYTAAS